MFRTFLGVCPLFRHVALPLLLHFFLAESRQLLKCVVRSCRLSVLRITILLVNWLWLDLIRPKSAAVDEPERLGRDVIEWFTRSCIDKGVLEPLSFSFVSLYVVICAAPPPPHLPQRDRDQCSVNFFDARECSVEVKT